MKVFESTTKKIFFASWVSLHQPETKKADVTELQASHFQSIESKWNFLGPLRKWLDNLKVGDRQFAHRVCRLIPAQCPFERDVKLFGRTLFHIPPMCKLNPLYEEVVGLRFRALCYLADECGEDISRYC
ncbi:Mo-dependent nitrogenase C-terminal domain-containing protein [Sphaerospermopsis aphanizomenoides BCCUSP55]|uniref:Mo-dependent nitrogenase C-terminal domain-containing protein n=1 Tax=Sphaerospermopsis aphanizomenoides TaxID=459663 RepID=UPI000ABEE903|nr:Mo-dependent nitrogenase C-terminal domain-containing protein [Sphaerospermopsis aphanizomenoides]MBK1987965.1 Mo-dependent nitrogenase C-terminal domain-containing protein [Sphaerospermopsis aphanizomenoides BCCUSP55]